MATQSLARLSERMPSVFDNFFKPWNEWYDSDGFFNRTIKVPAVNITEEKEGFMVSLAVPGMKKSDFKIDVDGNMLTISSEKEETKEEKGKKFNRKEYNFSSFSRSFSLPDEVNKEKIDARYEDGILKISLPRNESVKKTTAKQITVN